MVGDRRGSWLLAIAAVGLAACDTGAGIQLRVLSDLVAGLEVDRLEAHVAEGEMGAPFVARPVTFEDDLGAGVLLARLDGPPEAQVAIRIEARLRRGVVLAQQLETSLPASGVRQLTVVLDRACQDVACGSDETCRGGACGPASCGEGECPPSDGCAGDSSCLEPGAACAEARCVAQVCLALPVEGSDVCAADERCLPETGCAPTAPVDAAPPDAGPDAHVDSGVDGGPPPPLGPLGPPLWVQAFGTDGADRGVRGCVGAEGALFVVAWHRGTGAIGEVAIRTDGDFDDALLARFERDGALSWVRTLARADGHDRLMDVACDGDAIYVAGRVTGPSGLEGGAELPLSAGAPFASPVLCRYDSDGAAEWCAPLEGSANLWVTAVDVRDDQLVAAGVFGGTTESLGPEPQTATSLDVWIAGYAVDGQQRWATVFKGEGSESVHDLSIGPAGRVAVALRHRGLQLPDRDLSYTMVDNNDFASAIVWLSPDGDYLGAAAISGEGAAEMYRIGVTRGGDALVSGYLRRQVTFDGPLGERVAAGANDTFFARADRTEFTALWQHTGRPANVNTPALTVRGDGTALFGMRTAGTREYGPDTIVADGDSEAVVGLFAEDATTPSWALGFGGPEDQGVYDIVGDSSGVYVIGRFRTVIDGVGTASLGGYDAFVARLPYL